MGEKGGGVSIRSSAYEAAETHPAVVGIVNSGGCMLLPGI